MGNDNLETDTSQESGDSCFSSRNLLQPSWVRRAVQNGDGLDRFILDNYFYILLRLSILFWIIFFVEKIG
jgi:hypothetical protein